ncbi:ribosomal protein S18 acetylase RimI-like enzyme [Marinomonas alcarazii]|uniref:Ribosomal protein S18 acetylase RimI-like enzyme n=1 Tax=Marinomonas alcarazii TaxID=491949 RepID=A0A318V5T1_9GAMM|nr:GNAT family N-acetyltransferase/peptidase C39 family protein [Marinomonas alcarazii]PYF83181.1 ribosomal protein S18 acetylase RimI-like enzyme [Marinomonas alcarazii]
MITSSVPRSSVTIDIRLASIDDLKALLVLEGKAFTGDRLSRRSFRHAITSSGSALFVAKQEEGELLGYALLHLRQGTHLARLYSLAVSPEARGLGIGKLLIEACEKKALKKGKMLLRLEVSDVNHNAIALYQKMGYKEFGHYDAYYEDQTDAIRMQKRLRHAGDEQTTRAIPWLAQGTPFTCGPASLQMVLSSMHPEYQATPEDELEIWREATTIFMTSGHGGCHPMGLGLAAKKRGLSADVWLSEEGPLFVDSVRNELKKEVITRVHQSFAKQCENAGVPLHYSAMPLEQLIEAFDSGALAIILISTFRMDGKKSPHWVVMSGYDEHCILVHDPDLDDDKKLPDDPPSPLDCQFVPIARDEFEKMSRFGQSRLQATVVLRAQ